MKPLLVFIGFYSAMLVYMAVRAKPDRAQSEPRAYTEEEWGQIIRENAQWLAQ